MSKQGVEKKVAESLALQRRCIAVEDTRSLRKTDLPLNGALPEIRVNSETYEVKADGKLLTCEPAKVLPMAQRYFMF